MSPEKIKSAPCLFVLDVLCSYRKSEKFGVMDRCERCVHYFRFLKEMEEEEDEFFEEAEKIWKFGFPKRFDVPKGGS